MTKIIRFIDGKSVMVDENSTYLTFESGMVVDFHEFLKIGHCTCCGQDEFVATSGNIIVFYCQGDKMGKCEILDQCPGIFMCPKKGEFDQEREKIVNKMLEEMIVMILEMSGKVFINNSEYARHFVANHVLDESCIFGTLVARDENDKVMRFVTLSMNEKMLKDRAYLGKEMVANVIVRK